MLLDDEDTGEQRLPNTYILQVYDTYSLHYHTIQLQTVTQPEPDCQLLRGAPCGIRDCVVIPPLSIIREGTGEVLLPQG